MRFGTFVPQGWKMDLVGIPVEAQWPHMVSVAKTVEDAGYDSLWVYDHFHTHPVPSQESTFEAWSVMAGLAAVTDRVRLGQMCTCVPYRPASLLGKLALTVDAMSGGRLDVGIGAGWSQGEFRGYGYPFPRAGVRLDMLEEAARVLKAMWTEELARFEGEHYTLDGAIARPKSVQQPHPPLWIAGGGERRTLRIVAEHGDHSNFGKSVESFVHKSNVLASHCEAVGRDFAEIGRSVHLMSVIGRDDADLSAKLEVAARRRNSTPEEFADEHLAVTVGEAVEEMARYRDAGASEMILYFYDMGEGDSLELFAAEVAPHLR